MATLLVGSGWLGSIGDNLLFGLIILIIIVYAGIQQIDNLWLRPQYMGHALKLHHEPPVSTAAGEEVDPE